MPILWRYLAANYLKVMLICVCSFISVLLSIRIEEIAHFASLGAPLHYVFIFTIYQIPYVLPIVLPIAALIGGLLLFRKLSDNHELTALRSSGMSLIRILTPIYLIAGLFSIANFYIVSELATHSHLSTKLLKQELKSINPLILLQHTNLLHFKGIYVNVLGKSSLGEYATDVAIIAPHGKKQQLSLLTAKKLAAGRTNGEIFGYSVAIISNSQDNSSGQNKIFIENSEKMLMSNRDFTSMLKTEGWRLSNDHLSIRLLLERINDLSRNAAPGDKSAKKQINKSLSEIFRRVSVGIAVLTFTLLGTSFGIRISRAPKKRGLMIVIGLAAYSLINFFIAKELSDQLVLSGILYFIPHIAIITISLYILKRISRGYSEI